MISNHFSIVFAVLAVLAAPAHAAELTAVVSPGIAPAGDRDFGAKLLVCGTCHGAKGVPQNPTISVIWGQQENYLQKQLHGLRERGSAPSRPWRGWHQPSRSQKWRPQRLISQRRTGRRDLPAAPPRRLRP